MVGQTVSQVDGVKTCQLCGCLPFCLRESCPPALALMSDTSVPPCMPRVPFNLPPWCWSSEGVCQSKFMCGLRTAWDSRSFFQLLYPHWFLQPEAWGLTFLALVPWGGGPVMGLGLLTPEIILPSFYPPHVYVGPAHSASFPLLPVWIDVVFLTP